MSNQRIQETRAQCNISEYFAELLSCLRGGMRQIGMANQPVLKIRAEISQIVLNLFTSKGIVDVIGKKNNENVAKFGLSN